MANFNLGKVTDIKEYVNSLFDQSLTWSDVSWLKYVTDLPLVVKGIMRPDCAKAAVAHGADAIIVSNHGGRLLDGVPATIDVLPEIVEAVPDKVDVYMDGGVRNGSDVLKALALGAKMTFIGRPVVWGLAMSGQAGVAKTLSIMYEEFDNCLGLSGCTRVDEVAKQDLLYKRT